MDLPEELCKNGCTTREAAQGVIEKLVMHAQGSESQEGGLQTAGVMETLEENDKDEASDNRCFVMKKQLMTFFDLVDGVYMRGVNEIDMVKYPSLKKFVDKYHKGRLEIEKESALIMFGDSEQFGALKVEE